MLEFEDGVGMEHAAEVGAAEVGFPVGCGALQEDGLQPAGGESALEQGEVEWGVDGVSGEGVIELEAEVVVCGLRRGDVAKGEAGGGGDGCDRADWCGVGHCCSV